MDRRDFLLGSNVMLGSALIGLTYPSTAGASIRTSSPIRLDIRNFGAVGDGATDDTAAYLAALKALSDNSSLEFPSGVYNLDSVLLTATPARVTKNNITLFSNSGAKIVVTGTAACNIVTCNNKSGFVVRGLSFYGNNQATTISNGLCLYWGITGAYAVSGFIVESCYFENFKGDYWVSAHNAGSAKMSDVKITNNTFISRAGNSRGPATAAIDSACINIQGANNSATGTVENVVISDNTAECTYIKSFAVFYASTKNGIVANNVILNCGQLEVSDNCVAYGILIYDSSYGAGGVMPEAFTIHGNVIRAPRSCGIYVVLGVNITITGNIIQSQTDTVEATLPKGAISFNMVSNSIISGNCIQDNARGISLATCSYIGILSNKITSTIASSRLVNIAGVASEINIISNEMKNIGTTSQGVYIQGIASAAIAEINVANNEISATNACFQYVTADATQPLSLRIRNNQINSTAFGVVVTGITNPLTICGNVFTGNPSSPQIDASFSTKVSITDNVFEDCTTSCAMKLQGTQGTLWNNQFVRGVALVEDTVREDLGVDVPTWHAVIGTRVQCVWSGELGTSPNKYIREGWVYAESGWLENRSLTGH